MIAVALTVLGILVWALVRGGGRCAFGKHRMGSLATLYHGSDGWLYWPCVECSRPVRVRSAALAVSTLRLPRPEAAEGAALARVGRATEAKHSTITERALARNRRARLAVCPAPAPRLTVTRGDDGDARGAGPISTKGGAA